MSNENEKLQLIPEETVAKIAALDDEVSEILAAQAEPQPQPETEQKPLSSELVKKLEEALEAGGFDAAPSPLTQGCSTLIEVNAPMAPQADPADDDASAALDDLEREIKALPLEDGVTRADEPPEIAVQEPMASILMDGVAFQVCAPVKVPTTAQDPLFLLIESTPNVSLRDSMKLLVFDWGLQHLKDRSRFGADDGKRVIALINSAIGP